MISVGSPPPTFGPIPASLGSASNLSMRTTVA